MAVLRQLDLVVLVIALPIFIAAGFPLLGYAAAAVVWLVQKGIQVVATRRAQASDDPRTTVGLLAGSMIGRGWLVALSIFGVGLSDEDAGLAAAVLVIALFTVYFTTSMILRPFETEPER
jgi:hypothetical protein